MKTITQQALTLAQSGEYAQAGELCYRLARRAKGDVLHIALAARYMLRIEQQHTAIDLLYAIGDMLELSDEAGR
jgi:hypothetical protein